MFIIDTTENNKKLEEGNNSFLRPPAREVLFTLLFIETFKQKEQRRCRMK